MSPASAADRLSSPLDARRDRQPDGVRLLGQRQPWDQLQRRRRRKRLRLRRAGLPGRRPELPEPESRHRQLLVGRHPQHDRGASAVGRDLRRAPQGLVDHQERLLQDRDQERQGQGAGSLRREGHPQRRHQGDRGHPGHHEPRRRSAARRLRAPRPPPASPSTSIPSRRARRPSPAAWARCRTTLRWRWAPRPSRPPRLGSTGSKAGSTTPGCRRPSGEQTTDSTPDNDQHSERLGRHHPKFAPPRPSIEAGPCHLGGAPGGTGRLARSRS